MFLIKILPIFILILCCQRAEFKIIDHGGENEANLKGNNLEKSYPLAKTCNDARNLKEVWVSIKESALSSWNFIKEVAENARDRIKEWMQGAEKYATEVRGLFNDQLVKLKEKMKEIINELYGTGQIIKECYQQEKPKIQSLLSGITGQMGGCIKNEVKKLMQINSKGIELSLNDTQYIDELESQFEACEQDLENVDECMHNVRKGLFEDIQEMENKILETSSKSRSLVDNVKNTLVTCSLNNLADASFMISNEVMEITKCVMENNGNADETLIPEIKPEE